MLANKELGYTHVYEPPTKPSAAHTLLALHGTGGNEHDLVPLAASIAPGLGVLSPRGNVLERGMPRFFRRLAEGVFDEEDVIRRAGELAAFVTAAAERYGFDPGKVVAVGYSNGANIAAATLLLHPGVLKGAVLLRAMVPTVPKEVNGLTGTAVLLAQGRMDSMGDAEQTRTLEGLLRSGGADVRTVWHPAGHGLVTVDVEAARSWVQSAGLNG